MAWDKNLFSKIMTIFGFFMVVVFLVLGIALVFFPVYNYLPGNMKIIFGVFFITYGIFRLARLIQQIRIQNKKDFYDEK